ncbi:hypothetical protein [Burkholderia multivorans]|uniref:hypothetical protein n=1 Tax=Burkholderia multivorans TaxID=87883 RepID=UPI0021BFB34C|nr:hypothetical protein [Burkholderia multivorans]HEM7851931.1 hypothetical protein [Burkholderia multivorans]
MGIGIAARELTGLHPMRSVRDDGYDFQEPYRANHISRSVWAVSIKGAAAVPILGSDCASAFGSLGRCKADLGEIPNLGTPKTKTALRNLSAVSNNLILLGILWGG